ncbi:MAG TPA: hypothetical protein VH650_10170 [Gaiellaceae bacterium]|jgi:hypothetical protein
MRQHLRLRVLLPVAVLGLLGAGFFAWASGGPAAPSSQPVLPLPTTSTPTEPAPGPNPTGAVDAKEWAEQANALCAATNAEVESLGDLQTPKQFTESGEDLVAIAKQFDAAFVELGWPEGEKSAVVALRANTAQSTKVSTQMLAALEAGDVERFLRLGASLGDLGESWDAGVARLGADTCTKEATRIRPAGGLEWALLTEPVVVVVFYTPDAVQDSLTVLEARAATLATRSGFIAVDVTREQQVQSLAVGYEVLESPSVLVFTRGPKLAARFDGFVDRETVAQAVENARR